jgi:HPt (histidine-containing phosphotransfer) domain-containing protein
LWNIANSYLDALEGFQTNISSGIESRDWKLLNLSSHSLKSSSASLGAMRLANICKNIESRTLDKAIAKDLSKIHGLKDEFLYECDRVRLALSDIKQSTSDNDINK